MPPPVNAPITKETKTHAYADLLPPLDAAEFDASHARHLLWRAGFGGTEKQIATLVECGPERSVDIMLDFGDDAVSDAFDEPTQTTFDRDIISPPGEEYRKAIAKARSANDEDTLQKFAMMRMEREQKDRRQMTEIQKWWLRRMIESPRPLEEKLTLFWHGHFATNYRTIENSYHMFLQNHLFRTHAAGDFGKMLSGIIRDPAMLAYLDNNDSRKNKPNENLAREIMELFTLGVGNYTERDIKEGARALTGYTFDDDSFAFRRGNHDVNEKTIFGKAGNWDGDDFVRLILEREACAQFLARRLYNFFVADVPPDERGGDKEIPERNRLFIRKFGQAIFRSKFQMKPALRALFLSEHFYADDIRGQQIKSPTLLVVGAVRSLGLPVRDLGVVADAMELMGQRLMYPPNVKGWDGGRTWINTSTLFVRQNIVSYLLTGRKPKAGKKNTGAGESDFDPTPLLGDVAKAGNDAAARRILELTIAQTPTDASTTIAAHLKKTGTTPQGLVGALELAAAMPEYQLC